MSTERLDYGIERQRHEKFVGREALPAPADRRAGAPAHRLI